MADTPKLQLPLLAEAQESPDIPINDGSYIVDALLQGDVLERDVQTPPMSPDEGDAYILASSGLTGAFVGHASDVAVWQGGGWRFYQPRAGWTLYVVYDADRYRFDGGSPGEWFQDTATIEVSTAGSPSLDTANVRHIVFDNADVEDLGFGTVRVTPGTAAAAQPIEIQVALSDMTTDLTSGAGKAYIRAPRDMTITAVRASLFTVSSGGGPVTVDINVNGATILSTKLTIDDGEKTSVSAATPAVVSGPVINSDDEITFDIDDEGTGAKGLIVTILGTRD